MSTKNQSQHAKLNFSDCMGMAIGQIIGSGVMVLTGIVIGLTGHGTPLAYILGALLAITTCIPCIILTSTIIIYFAASKNGFIAHVHFCFNILLFNINHSGFGSGLYLCEASTGR